MSKHTPGPWEAVLDRGNVCEWRVFASHAEQGDRMPAECYGPNAQANARLIAAAPDLLEVLKLAVEKCSEDDEVWLNRVWVKDALAAIGKAEGKS